MHEQTDSGERKTRQVSRQRGRYSNLSSGFRDLPLGENLTKMGPYIRYPENTVSIIACPKCSRQYQVKGDPSGKNVKCANCQHVFTVPGPSVAQPAAAAAAAQPVSQAGPATPQSKLFPDVIPPGPDPLANHVIQDPGFADVDINAIRQQRESTARKANKLADAYTASSSLAKMEEEEFQKKKSRVPNQGLMDKDTLFGFDGRINRQKWWLSAILSGLAGGFIFSVVAGAYFMILFVLDVRLPNAPDQIGTALGVMIPFFIMFAIFGIIMTWISLALHIKRYHDLDKSGFWMLLAFVPIIGGIWVFVECGFFKGNTGKNAYGPDPLAPKPVDQ